MAKKESTDVYAKAEALGIKKENLEIGLKKDKAKMEEAINKAYKFMKGG